MAVENPDIKSTDIHCQNIKILVLHEVYSISYILWMGSVEESYRLDGNDAQECMMVT